MKIADVDAYQVFDSRGNPTVEAIVTLSDGSVGRGIVPSGASTGKHEALELRDGVPQRFRGKSVFQAVANVKLYLKPALLDLDEPDQATVDRCLVELDGTDNKSRLGANAILATSMAFCNAEANSRDLPLFEHLGNGYGTLIPLPEIQLVGGGTHASGAIDVQDFMIVATAAKTFEEALEVTFNVYHEAAAILREEGRLYGLADEGGFWPVVKCNEAVFDLILKAIQRAGYTPGESVMISLDIAASDMFRDGYYILDSENRRFTPKEFASFLAGWIKDYPIVSIEDPMADEDWDGWRLFMDKVGNDIQVIGDDLFTTNVGRIEQGIKSGVANAVLIKLNQIGTVTETIEAVRITQQAGWNPVISARSGETEDAFIAHLAVALNAGQLKVGSFARSERMVKWNEVLRIQRQLAGRAQFAGSGILRNGGRRRVGGNFRTV